MPRGLPKEHDLWDIQGPGPISKPGHWFGVDFVHGD